MTMLVGMTKREQKVEGRKKRKTRNVEALKRI
jgi:hypothetical protein